MTLAPLITLHPCHACAEHVRGGTSVCPHCGATQRPRARAAVLLLGTALAACIPSEPDYGVPTTDADTETDTGGETDADPTTTTTTGK